MKSYSLEERIKILEQDEWYEVACEEVTISSVIKRKRKSYGKILAKDISIKTLK